MEMIKENRLYWFLIFSVVLFVVSISCFAIQSEDLFMYLAIAREYFKLGHFPATDPFLFSIPNYSWVILHQWLSYLTFYGVYQLGGYNLLVVFKLVLILVTVGLPAVLVRKSRGALPVWAVSVLIALLASNIRLMERSSMFSDLFIVLVLGIVLAEHQRPSWMKYLLPGIFLLWVNLHPGFPLGWALCGLFLIFGLKKWRDSEYRKFLALTLVSVLVCLLNPRGLEGFLYPFQFMGGEAEVYKKFYFEWMPTLSPIFIKQMQTFYLAVLVLMNFILLYRARKQRPFFELALSLLVIAYGLSALRFVPTMCFSLICVNCFLAVKIQMPFWPQKKYASLAVAIFCLGLGIKNIGWGYETISGPRHFGWGLDERVVPFKAVDLINRGALYGHLYNSHMFGGYLAWALEKNVQVLYHGFVTDTDFFLKEYAGFSRSAADFDAQVAKYQIGAFIIDRFMGQEALLEILTHHSQWDLIYRDESALLFAKKVTPPSP